jgi:dihydroflavonol-4-reductase
MHMFVTGGNGFIGSAVVRLLVSEGHSVTCLLRPTSKVDRLVGTPCARVAGDIRDPASLRQGMQGCDGVIHLASISNWEDMRSTAMRDVVVDGTRNVLAAAKATAVKRVVYVSSSTAVNGSTTPLVHNEDSPFEPTDPGLAYAHAKRAAEQLCREAVVGGMPVVIVNPAEVYGPNDASMVTAGNLVDFIKSKPVMVCRGGTSVVHVDDVAAGILAAAVRGRSGERYLLAGENLSIRQLAELTLSLVGRKGMIVTIPHVVLRVLAWCGSTLRMPLPFNPSIVPYATLFWFMDGSKATRELGIGFRSAHDTLAPTIAWLKESGRIS